MGGLPSPSEAGAIWTDIWHHEAHNSTAIEGNTLALHEVEELLEHGKAVGAKELREYLEVRGYADAATWVYGQAIEPGGWSHGRLLTLSEVRHVHHAAMTPVWNVAPHTSATELEIPGSFRRHNIQPFRRGMRPPDFTEVPALMSDWVDDACRIRESGGPLPLAIARSHGAFERIHPFLDGNGRTGRLLINLLFVRLGYPPAIIYKRDRARYLAALQRTDAGDLGPLGELLARAVLDNLYRFVVPTVSGPRALVPLAALATKELSAPALRQAVLRGRLQAQRGADGQWRSSRAWLDEYLASRYRRSGQKDVREA